MRTTTFSYSALVLILINQTLPSFCTAESISWDDGGLNKNWSNPFNWSPTGSPAGDDLSIGNLAAAQFDQTIIDQDYIIGSLTITNGADADTNGNFLDVDGDITLSNSGTSFISREHSSDPGTTSADTFNITINSGGAFQSLGGRTIVAVPGPGAASSGVVDINAGGVFTGWGTLRYQDGLDGTPTTQLFNDGILRAARDGAAPDSERFTLLIESTDGGGNALVDLDGTSDNGVVNIDTNATLDVNTNTTEYWGTMNFDPGAEFEINSQLNVRGTAVFNIDAATTLAGVPSTARIRGNTVDAIGNAQFNVNSGTLILDTRLETGGAPDINLADDTGLTFNRISTFNGNLNLYADDLTLTFNNQVTINDSEMNWDGISGNASTTVINDSGDLTINSDTIETSLDGSMDGDIEINSGRLTANITDGWTFGGMLTMDTSSGQADLDGTELTVDGGQIRKSTGNGGAFIFMPVNFTNSASTIAESFGGLYFTEVVTFEGGSSHTGTGLIAFSDITANGSTTINMPDSEVRLDNVAVGTQVVSLNDDFTINAKQLGNTNQFGNSDDPATNTININNSTSTLTINLTDPGDEWTLAADGTINVTAPGTVATSLAGSDLNIEGTINVNGDTRFSSRIDLEAGGAIHINGGTSSLQLIGGSVGDPNRINGGLFQGDGSLALFNKQLVGYGQINTPINFTGGADLVAEGGLLVLLGDVVNVDRLISSGATATLLLSQTLDTAGIGALELVGGTVDGLTITNNGLTEGFGSIETNGFVNTGTLRATSGAQPLVVDTTNAPDLDGVGINGVLEAVSGTLRIVKTPTDAFGGNATVGPTRSILFDNSWTLGTNGTLNLDGGNNSLIAAVIQAGGTSHLDGNINVDGFGRIAGAADFGAPLTVNLSDSSDTLELAGDSTIDAGTTFTGLGQTVNRATATLTIDGGFDSSALRLTNHGELHLGSSSGQVELARFQQSTVGTLFVELAGTGPTELDSLSVDSISLLAGTLDVELIDGFTPTVGDTFSIFSGSFTGIFSTENLPTLGGSAVFQVHYNPTSVILEVVAALTADFDNDGDVDGNDFLVWQRGGSPNGINSGDLVLWEAQYGSVLPLAAASTAVPEPASAVLFVLATVSLLLNRQDYLRQSTEPRPASSVK